MEFYTSSIAERTRLKRALYEDALNQRKRRRPSAGGHKEVNEHSLRKDYEQGSQGVSSSTKKASGKGSKNVVSSSNKDSEPEVNKVIDVEEFLRQERPAKARRVADARTEGGESGRKQSTSGLERGFHSRHQSREADEVECISADEFEEEESEANDDMDVQEIDETEFMRLSRISSCNAVNNSKQDTCAPFASNGGSLPPYAKSYNDMEQYSRFSVISESRSVESEGMDESKDTDVEEISKNNLRFKGGNILVNSKFRKNPKDSELEVSSDDFDELSSSSESEDDSDDEDFVVKDSPSITMEESSSDSEEVYEDEREEQISEKDSNVSEDEIGDKKVMKRKEAAIPFKKKRSIKYESEKKVHVSRSKSSQGGEICDEHSLKRKESLDRKSEKRLDSSSPTDDMHKSFPAVDGESINLKEKTEKNTHALSNNKIDSTKPTNICKSRGRRESSLLTGQFSLKREKNFGSKGEDHADICAPTNKWHDSRKEMLKTRKDDSSFGEETGVPTKGRRVAAARYEDILNTLLDSILEKSNSLDDESNVEEEPPDGGIPLKFRFDDEDEYPPKEEKSEFDLMVDGLFAELDYSLKCAEMESSELPEVENEKIYEDSDTETNQFILCHRGKHQHFFDEQIGIRCSCCKEVLIESKYVLPQLVKITTEAPLRTYHAHKNESPMFDALAIPASRKNIPAFCKTTEGTVWDIMPNTRETMYAHQQEGFEFLWKNLMGTINLLNLKNSNLNGVGGCIISHAPGTGKSRLTIVFIESFLNLFPNSLPVIIAPASVLLTWEGEFKKWEVKFPFYNLNALKLGKNKDIARAMMLRDWAKGRSILGVSYNLYEKLAGKKLTKENGKKKKVKAVFVKEDRKMRRILLELPDLVILDEGHTPRNQRSCIWNTILKLKTEKRVILSGTPFQNNFEELFNTLRIVRPGTANALAEEEDFVNMIRIRPRRQGRKEGTSLLSSNGKAVEEAIDRLKATIAPFVHVHKGSILKESLPGLRDCLILLNPPPLQKRLIDAVEVSNNIFDFDHKVALISVHPSLVVHCRNLSDKEKSIIKPQQLKELRLKPDEGVKMRFLRIFVPLCLARNEKVLIFSQFKGPLNFIKKHLGEILDGDVEKKVLQLEGKTNQRQRKKLIEVFNDPKGEAVVMLASTKCCSEGIHLVGASRVVLLDVVWNPSVERQAICRAYRLGQTKVVHTYHLITCGTTEREKYTRQSEKDRLSELVFSSSTNEENCGKKTQFTNLQDVVLSDLISQKKLEGMFEEIVYQPKEQKLLDSFCS